MDGLSQTELTQLITDTFEVKPSDRLRHARIWNAWMNHRERGFMDFYYLLESEVNEVYKARVIAIMLRAYYDEPVFGDKSKYGWLRFIDFDVSSFSEKLLGFTAEVLERNVASFRERVRSGDIGAYNVENNFYQFWLLRMLSVLPYESPAANRLFALYDILDLHIYTTANNHSGYTGFEKMLSHPVDIRYKREFDQKMRHIIEREEKGIIVPRRVWERALWQYIEIVVDRATSNKYEVELLGDQVVFLLDNYEKKLRERLGVDFCNTLIGIYLQLTGIEYKNLKYRLIKLAFSGSLEEIRVAYVTKPMEVEIRENYGFDSELISILDEIVLVRNERSEEVSRRIEKSKEIEDKLYNDMKE